jgi:hypothetical protein
VQTDKDGRYKIPLFLAGSYSVEISGPAGEPYLPMTRGVGWPRATARQELNLTLARGVRVKGKVTETPAGKPVADARVDFWSPGLKLPEGVRFPSPLTTAADGTFQVLLPTGTWHLLVNVASSNYVYQKLPAAALIGERATQVSLPNGPVVTYDPNDKKRYFYPDGWVKLDLKAGADTQEPAVKLRRATLKGKLVDPEGKPAAKAVLFSRPALPRSPAAEVKEREQRLAIRAFYGAGSLPGTDEPNVVPVDVRGGKFELPVRDEQAKHQLFFLDPKNKLGAIAEVSAREAAEKALTVKLVPCGSAKARFLDAKGKPKAKYQPLGWLLLPPGPHAVHQNPGRGFALQNGVLLSTTGGGFGMWDANSKSAPGAHDRVWLKADTLNYGKGFATDAQGKITFPALIPGGTYRIALPNGKVKDFKAESGKTVDLGDITVADPAKPAQPKGPPVRLRVRKVKIDSEK